MNWKHLLASLALTAGTLASGAASAQEIAIASAGGAWQAAQREAWYKPFAAKMGIKFNEEETASSSAGRCRRWNRPTTLPSTSSPSNPAAIVQFCDAGLLTKLDWSRIATAPRTSSPAPPSTAASASTSTATCSPTTPPCSRTAPPRCSMCSTPSASPASAPCARVAVGNLEWALMADGVPIDQVYKVLATPAGVDRAFAKLDTIKQDIVWWTAGAQPPQLLASHEVVMTTAWNGRIQNPIDQEGKPFRIAWDHQIIEFDMVAIPKGAPHLDLAYKYLAFISTPENNGRLGQFIPYGPVVKAATQFVPAATLAKLPTAPDHMKKHAGHRSRLLGRPRRGPQQALQRLGCEIGACPRRPARRWSIRALPPPSAARAVGQSARALALVGAAAGAADPELRLANRLPARPGDLRSGHGRRAAGAPKRPSPPRPRAACQATPSSPPSTPTSARRVTTTASTASPRR